MRTCLLGEWNAIVSLPFALISSYIWCGCVFSPNFFTLPSSFNTNTIPLSVIAISFGFKGAFDSWDFFCSFVSLSSGSLDFLAPLGVLSERSVSFCALGSLGSSSFGLFNPFASSGSLGSAGSSGTMLRTYRPFLCALSSTTHRSDAGSSLMTRISLLSLATSEQRTDPSLKRNLLFKLPFWSNTRTSWWYLSIMISTNRLSSWSVLTPQTSSSANRRLRGWKERKKMPFSSKILTIWSPLSTTMKCPSLFMAMSCATFNFFSFSGPWPNDHGKQ